MVSNFERHPGQGEQPDWYSFHLTLSAWDMPVVSTGWKFFPATGTIKPPSYQTRGKTWAPAFQGVNGEVLKRLREAVAMALGPIAMEKEYLEGVATDVSWDGTPLHKRPAKFPIGTVIYGRRLVAWVQGAPEWEDGRRECIPKEMRSHFQNQEEETS